MPQPSRFQVLDLVPFLAMITGLALSTWRFRAHDSVGGLAFGLVGMVLMLVLAVWLPTTGPGRPGER